ncbi:MAG TPA: hypothetical protein VEA41_19025, partial [Salinarimonas sp.]|nr:hypothetical protein [Salinarimonas sp.]
STPLAEDFRGKGVTHPLVWARNNPDLLLAVDVLGSLKVVSRIMQEQLAWSPFQTLAVKGAPHVRSWPASDRPLSGE